MGKTGKDAGAELDSADETLPGAGREADGATARSGPAPEGRAGIDAEETLPAPLDLTKSAGALELAGAAAGAIDPGALGRRAGEPSNPAPQDDLPLLLLERFDGFRFLGQGGMGTVYQARDLRLGRDVAIKLLHGGDPEGDQSLLREARSQARIEHDNICRIYETGAAEGRRFIVMQLIEGEPLDKAQARMTMEQKVKLLKTTATALHEAHRTGVIHRDIKPSNILVERNEDGTWKPYVVDFGLARDMEARGGTITGVIAGTPAFMAPEQARGEVRSLDRRTDVFSLGATLYYLLAGRPPFVAPNLLKLLRDVGHEDALPLRRWNREIPRDLETIVMKCLEREPHRRYSSARELADDLQRYLDGDPIAGRRPTLTYVLLRKARKHKVLIAISGIALVSVLSVAGVAARRELRAAEQARVAQQVGQDIKEVELFMRYAYALPVHDVGREKAVMRERMRAIEEKIERAGSVAGGPGHYALGRGHMALHEYELALERFKKSLDAGYTSPDVELAMGVALGELYRRALDDAQRIEDRDAREARRSEIDKIYLASALAHMRASRGAQTESQAYIDALIAFYEKKYDDAVRSARQAFEQSPWSSEAKRLEGDALFIQGNEKQDRGDYDGANADYSRAAEAYRGSLDISSSDATIYEALAELWLQVMAVQRMREGPSEDAFKSVLAACDSALLVDPKSANALSKRSRAQVLWGIYLLGRGADPRAALSAAIAAGLEAVKLSPRDAITYDNIGNAHTVIGMHELTLGIDPRPSLELAIESYQQAIQANPAFAWALNDMGVAHTIKARYEAQRGLDPRPSVATAVEYFRKAIQVKPTYVYPYANMGDGYATQALYEVALGMDPSASSDRAVSACQQAIKMAQDFYGSFETICRAQLATAQFELMSGLPAQATLDKTVESCTKAMELNPASLETHQSMGAARRLVVLHRMERGLDAAAALAEARAAARKVIEIHVNAPPLLLLQGQLEILAARVAMETKAAKEPIEMFQAADVYLRRALEQTAASAELFEAIAELHLLQARWRARRDQPLDSHVAEGLASTEKAIQVNPRSARAMALAGELHLVTASRAKGAAERQDAAQRARSELEQAIQTNTLLRKEIGGSLVEAERLSAASGSRP